MIIWWKKTHSLMWMIAAMKRRKRKCDELCEGAVSKWHR